MCDESVTSLERGLVSQYYRVEYLVLLAVKHLSFTDMLVRRGGKESM